MISKSLIITIGLIASSTSLGKANLKQRVTPLEETTIDLQDQIDNIELTPGPEGPQGPVGPHGPVGPEGPATPDARFGNNTSYTLQGKTLRECVLGEIMLFTGRYGQGIPAKGQLLQIAQYDALFSLMGTRFGGDGRNTFGLPDLRDAAPNGLTYTICHEGLFPSQQ